MVCVLDTSIWWFFLVKWCKPYFLNSIREFRCVGITVHFSIWRFFSWNHLQLFSKTFVKVTVLLKKLLNRWFDEILFWLERMSRFSTLCSNTFLTFSWKYVDFLKNVSSNQLRIKFFSQKWFHGNCCNAKFTGTILSFVFFWKKFVKVTV